MILTRRKLISGAAALIAAPAIIRVADLMKIKPVRFVVPLPVRVRGYMIFADGRSVELQQPSRLLEGNYSVWTLPEPRRPT